jgi:hypothetical protein
MVKAYEYETGYYEYTDEEGYKRIGRWRQKYEVERGYYGYGFGEDSVRRKKVGMVDFYEEDDDEYIGTGPGRRECPHCLEYGFHVKLQGGILEKGQPKPVDYANWLQCHSCGNIYAKHEIERQKKLKADTKQHKVENEFEVGETIVSSVPTRSSPAGKKTLEKRRRERQRTHHKDSEIDREIQRHGEENVHVVYDSDP